MHAATIVIRRCPWLRVGTDALRALLIMLTADIEVAARQARCDMHEANACHDGATRKIAQNATFGLVKAIITRRLVVDEVYDIIDRIQGVRVYENDVAGLPPTNNEPGGSATDQMVRSVRPNAQKLCAQVHTASCCAGVGGFGGPSIILRPLCFLQVLNDFLLHYPMTEDRLQQHLRHLLVNMAYEYEEGRLAVRACARARDAVLPPWLSRCWEQVLDMLHAVLLKFPVPVLDEQTQFILLPLVVRRFARGARTCLLLLATQATSMGRSD